MEGKEGHGRRTIPMNRCGGAPLQCHRLGLSKTLGVRVCYDLACVCSSLAARIMAIPRLTIMPSPEEVYRVRACLFHNRVHCVACVFQRVIAMEHAE